MGNDQVKRAVTESISFDAIYFRGLYRGICIIKDSRKTRLLKGDRFLSVCFGRVTGFPQTQTNLKAHTKGTKQPLKWCFGLMLMCFYFTFLHLGNFLTVNSKQGTIKGNHDDDQSPRLNFAFAKRRVFLKELGMRVLKV